MQYYDYVTLYFDAFQIWTYWSSTLSYQGSKQLATLYSLQTAIIAEWWIN
jgi:hypothetical protein